MTKYKNTTYYDDTLGRRGSDPKGVIIHNDAGSNRMNGFAYVDWLVKHDIQQGIA